MQHRRQVGPIPRMTTTWRARLLAGALTGAVAAQCTTQWGATPVNMDDEVLALAETPGGTVFAAGRFSTAAGQTANRVAAWSSGTWRALGTGMPGRFDVVRALAVLPNGDLVAAGSFAAAGGIAARNIALWNGTAWSALGSGTSGEVRALAVLANGDIIAGGYFATAGGLTCNNIARWNGSAWSALGSGVSSIGSVLALAVHGNGDLFAGGTFFQAGGAPASLVARWDGSRWSALGSGLGGPNGLGGPAVLALRVSPAGALFASGGFPYSGSVVVNNIAAWDGTTWSPLGAGLEDQSTIGTEVRSLTMLPSGELLAAGGFTHSGQQLLEGIARWNGATWSRLSTGLSLGIHTTLFRSNGALLAGGEFASLGGVPSPWFATMTTSCLPSATTYGSGCPSSAGIAACSAVGPPWIGSSIRLRTVGTPANAAVLWLLSPTQLMLPLQSVLPPALPGCSLLAGTEFALPMSAAAGTAELGFRVPAVRALAGTATYSQTLIGEVVAGRLAVTSSNGVRLLFGSF